MNLDETREWLDLLYGDTPGLIHISSTGNWAGRCFDDTDHALAYIQQLDATKPEGIYLRATTLREAPESGRGGDTLSSHLPGLWADVDIAGPGHKTTQPLPPTVEDAMRIVNESGLPEPSHWIHSGGGLYPWWILRNPAEISDLETIRVLSATWQKILEASATKLGFHYGSGVGDLSRVLRIPGTINRKEGLERPCGGLEGHSWGGPTYELQELLDAMVAAAPEPPAPTRVELKLQQQNGTRPGDDYNARMQWIDLLGPLGWTWVYKRGDKWHLRRPGKTHGTSATLSLTTDRFYPFSEAATPFEPWKHYSKFEAFSTLEYNGDYAAAARALRGLGYGAAATPVPVASPGPAAGLAQADWADEAIDAAATAKVQGTEVAVKDPDWPNPWAKPFIPADALEFVEHSYAASGRVFANIYQDTFKYCPELKKWYYFNGATWEQDRLDAHDEAAIHMLEETGKRARADDNTELAKWIRSMGRTSGPNLARWARSNPRLAVLREQFDQRRHLITVANGIFDLDTATFTDGHDPKLLLTKKLGIKYDKDATCPRWDSFLTQVLPDEAVRGYIQRAAGLTLLGNADERALFLLHGKSGTGKSQFIRMLELLFGDFAETASATTFNASSKTATLTNDLNDLRGKRFVSLSELDQDERLNESLVKRLTGGDTAKSRGLYQENRQWRVEFMMWMATNYLPRLNSDDNAIWKRVKPIEFPTEVASLGSEVNGLAEKIFAEEASGILNWLLEGVRMYQDHGLDDLAQITEAVATYRRDVDSVAQFMDTATEEGTIVQTHEAQMPSRNLHTMYQTWCNGNGIRWLGERRFGQRMESLGFERKRVAGGIVWLGVGTGSYGMLGTMAMRQ